MGGKQLFKAVGLILCWAGDSFSSIVLASVYDGKVSDEAAYLRNHVRDLYKVIDCQEKLLEQTGEGELPGNITGYCLSKFSASTKNNHTVSRFNIIFDQFLGITSSVLTAAPPTGSIVINLYMVHKGSADKVLKRDFTWPLLDVIANAFSVAYFLHGRYVMGRNSGDQDISPQSVAIGFDIATMVLMFAIMRWQTRQAARQLNGQEAQ